jgi:isopentenyldiphosphate isomerase
MSDKERANIIDYFLTHTNYSKEFLLGTKQAQLLSMYKRTKERMASYPEEIIAYYNSHPEIYVRPSDEKIRSMKYEELSRLRKELGIRAKRGTKVTKTVEAKPTADKARKIIKEQPVAKVAAEVIVCNMTYKEPDYVQEQFLTPEEIEMMYPESDYSMDELAERGIIVTPHDGVIKPRRTKK